MRIQSRTRAEGLDEGVIEVDMRFESLQRDMRETEKRIDLQRQMLRTVCTVSHYAAIVHCTRGVGRHKLCSQRRQRTCEKAAFSLI